MMLQILIGAMIVLCVIFMYLFVKDFLRAWKAGKLEKDTSFLKMGIVGFVCLFFDVLGIGCFSTLTACIKTFDLSKDKTLPGTLVVASSLSGIVFAIIFMTTIEVDPLTLIVMTVAAAAGAYFGASVISKMPEKIVQLAMGVAMLIVAVMMFLGQVNLMPGGGNAIGLSGVPLVISGVVLFILGALMTVGVGLFAPCMALVYAMGMSPTAAFPIMMTACAFLQPTASLKFIKEGTYDRKASMAITIFGIVAGLIACYLVKSIPLYALKWIVFAVVLYTAFKMFRSYAKNQAAVTEQA